MCACPTTRKARLVRTRRKKDAERGESAKQTCTSGSLFFCFLFFGEAKKRKCPVGTRRMVKTTLQADHTAVTLFQAAFGGRGKVCKRRAQRGCTAYGCGCHQLCGEVNSKCRRAADAPFLGFQAAFGGGQVCRSGIYARQTQTCLSFRYTTTKNIGHKCPTYLGLVFRLPLLDKQRQPENHIRATIGVKPTSRYLSPIAIKLALPPAAVVFSLHEISW